VARNGVSTNFCFVRLGSLNGSALRLQFSRHNLDHENMRTEVLEVIRYMLENREAVETVHALPACGEPLPLKRKDVRSLFMEPFRHGTGIYTQVPSTGRSNGFV
jgi:hypothetical protein